MLLLYRHILTDFFRDVSQDLLRFMILSDQKVASHILARNVTVRHLHPLTPRTHTA